MPAKGTLLDEIFPHFPELGDSCQVFLPDGLEAGDVVAEPRGEFLEAGVAIVGGCCGSTPDHVRAIRRAVDTFKA